MVKYVLISLALFLLPVAARATSCTVPHTFVTGETLTETVLNSNPQALASCINGNIDNSNIGAAGIYASQIIPDSVTHATFGGSTTFIFPTSIVTGGTVESATNFTAGDLAVARGSNSGFMFFGTASGSSGAGAFGYSGGNYQWYNAGATSTIGSLSNTGVLTTNGAQSCGNRAGYHIECGNATLTSCVGGATCDLTAITFSTAFASAPFCVALAQLAGGQAPVNVTLKTVSTSAVTFTVYNGTANTISSPSEPYICVGT